MNFKIKYMAAVAALILPTVAFSAPSNDQKRRLAMQNHLDGNAPLMSASWIGTHNSYNNKDKGYVLPNHKVNMIDQLRAGFRVLNYDLHYAYFEVRLCHSSYGSGLCGAGDTPIQNAMDHLRNWLRNNPNEVVMIGIEDYLKDDIFTKQHNIAADKIDNKLGDFIYAPKHHSPARSGGCQDLPIRQLTKQDVLDAGKQVVMTSFSGCKGTDRFKKWVWNMPIEAYKGNEGPNANDLNHSSKLSSVYEDRTFGKGPVDTLSDNQVKTSLEKGANIIALDFGVDINRHSGAIWSWATNEPSANSGEDCAKVNSSGWWGDATCNNNYVYACQNLENGNWVTSTTAGHWSGGDVACANLGDKYIFSAPTNAQENKALKAKTFSSTWVNASDLATEGHWQIHNFVHEAIENGRNSSTLLRRYTKATNASNEVKVGYSFKGEVPSLFLSAASSRDGDPGLLAFTDINKERAKVKFIEWNYQNNKHDKEDFDIMAMPNGIYRMNDGSIWEVGQFKVHDTKTYYPFLFENNFTENPYLYLTIQGPKRDDRVVIKAKGLNNEGFQAALYEQEKSTDSHNGVTVSYLAIQPPKGKTSSSFQNRSGVFNYQVRSSSLNHSWRRIGQYDYKLHEEQSKDRELTHNYETVHWLSINGAEFIQAVSNNGDDPFSIRRR